jgi:hypothetical protein
MKITDLSPKVTPYKEGKTLRASSWRTVDCVNQWGDLIRNVFHYETLMAEFIWLGESEGWSLCPLSVGHGSVSDQKAMNQLLVDNGSRIKFLRNNGNPRYVNIDNGGVIHIPF